MTGNGHSILMVGFNEVLFGYAWEFAIGYNNLKLYQIIEISIISQNTLEEAEFHIEALPFADLGIVGNRKLAKIGRWKEEQIKYRTFYIL